MTKVTATYYISSGRKNAMYTLRVERRGGEVAVDNYLCNLSTDAELAEKKAQDYYDRIKERLTDTEYFETKFAGYADFDLFERRGALSVYDTEKMELIEQGIMPIGKHTGTRFENMAPNSVLWFADQSKVENNKPVFQAVCEACMGVALEKNYIAARDDARQKAAAEQEAAKLASQYVGEVGKRQDFTGTVEAVVFVGARQVAWNTFAEKYMTKFRCGDDIVVYFGNNLGLESGAEVTFKATVKNHEIYNETKQTTVARVKVL